LKRCCKETWSSHSTKQTSAVHKTVPMTMSRGESKLQRSSYPLYAKAEVVVVQI